MKNTKKKQKKITLTQKQLQNLINKAVKQAVKKETKKLRKKLKIEKHEKEVFREVVKKPKIARHLKDIIEATRTAKEQNIHKSTRKKYDSFDIIFSGIKQHHIGSDIDNDTDIFKEETFIRNYPVYPKMSLADFKKRHATDAINEELKVFENIAEDQEYGVHWSNWKYEIRVHIEDIEDE